MVAFPRGEAGSHQVINRTDAPIRVLMLSTNLMPEILHYPDSRKFGLLDAADELIIITRPEANLDYWDGEDSARSTRRVVVRAVRHRHRGRAHRPGEEGLLDLVLHGRLAR